MTSVATAAELAPNYYGGDRNIIGESVREPYHLRLGRRARRRGKLRATLAAKAEWLYLNLDDRHFSVTAANNGLAANLMRLGLNYHF